MNGVSRASERGGFEQARVNNFRMADFLQRCHFWVIDSVYLCLTSCILWVMAFMASLGGALQARVNNFRMAEFLLRVQSRVTYDIKLCLTSCILSVCLSGRH